MELTIARDELFRGLQRAQGVVSNKGAMPILANVLIDATESGITLFATNLDIGIRGEYQATVTTPGKVTAQAKNLHDIMRELPAGSEVSIKVDDDARLRVVSGKSKFNLATMAADDYPDFPEYDETGLISFDSAMLLDMIQKTSYAISQDETRLTLNGALLDVTPTNARMVATDGHRLAYTEREGAFPVTDRMQSIITRKAIAELKKLLDENDDPLNFLKQDNHILFRKGSLTMLVRLVEGAFPNYEQVIPSGESSSTSINVERLTQALRRVSVLSDEKSHMVRISFGKNVLELASEGGELGEARDEIDIEFSGNDLTVGLNAQYLLELLNSLNDEEVIFKLQSDLSPVMVKSPTDPGLLCIVMPMRL